jgi:hypothetical protein
MSAPEEKFKALTASVMPPTTKRPTRKSLQMEHDLAAAWESIAVYRAHLEAAHASLHRLTMQPSAIVCSGCHPLPHPREDDND